MISRGYNLKILALASKGACALRSLKIYEQSYEDLCSELFGWLGAVVVDTLED